jgi:DNA-binding GntR family transcriptional regulator
VGCPAEPHEVTRVEGLVPSGRRPEGVDFPLGPQARFQRGLRLTPHLTLDQTGETMSPVEPAPAPVDRKRHHRTMAEVAAAELQEAILTGELAPGAPLRLEDLARTLGMSISPVREAVRRLETLGLAVHVPHRGARVTELAIEDLYDTYEARLALEALAIRRAAVRFTDEDATRAGAFLDEYAESNRRGDARAARRAHAGFHFALYAASGSEWLMRLIRPTWENCERYRALSLPGRSLRQRRAEHQDILSACVRHEPDEAAERIRLHLSHTANLVARRMGAGDLFDDAGPP